MMTRQLRWIAIQCIAAACVVLAPTPAPAGAPALDAAADRELAAALLERAGARRGLCALAGGSPELALELVRASELLVYVRARDRAAAQDLRRRAGEAGFGIDRLVVEEGSVEKLPFAEHLADLVLVVDEGGTRLEKLKAAEVLRALRPEGKVIAGRRQPADGAEAALRDLKEWAGASAEAKSWSDAHGVWIEIQKPRLEGADEWTHWEHSPDNNPVSSDQVIRAPYMTQFLAGPLYIGMPSVTTAAGGRTFLAIGHIAHHEREWETLYRLIARNGYNGTVLWEQKLPEGYLVHRSAFIATRDTFHRIDGERCLLLDPATGKEKGEVRIPGLEGEWKWMALEGNVLYALAGKPGAAATTTKGARVFGGWSWDDLSKEYYVKRIPSSLGDTLAAYDLSGRKTLWVHKEETLIDSRCMALGSGRMYLYCPDRHLRALDAATGKVVWTNADADVRGLIEKPGRGLTSTPGFRTACMAVLTPKALILQGQTLMHVVAVSTADGYLLWTKDKITNNPNAIYVGDDLVLGIGPGGSHVALDPVSGSVREDLRFHKRACTRLTASPDSFFCRGEGTLRFDRAAKKLLVDGAVRPACNDGALPANGMLYLGPWQCDCNLSLIGHMGKCSAGEFRFDHVARDEERLERGEGNIEEPAPFTVAELDWPTERADNARSASTRAAVPQKVRQRWEYVPERPFEPCAPVSAGGLVFTSGLDGKVRALEAQSGKLRWVFSAPAPIRSPPTIHAGRAFFGCEDGFVYALEAASGRLLWRFRAAPVERHLLLYGSLASTWPVNTGVLVHDGACYLAAGIIDHDGTYVYALDERTGRIRWQNNSSGHLSRELRKGVSAQGNLTLVGDRLLLAGGNQVSPAAFDLGSGECLEKSFQQGEPKANGGRYVAVFGGDHVVAGGRILYSSPRNVATKGSFSVSSPGKGTRTLAFGGVPPAWNDEQLLLVNFKNGKLSSFDSKRVREWLAQPEAERRGDQPRGGMRTVAQALEGSGALRWQTDMGEPTHFEALSLAAAANAAVAVVSYQHRFRAQPQWSVIAVDTASGQLVFEHEVKAEPLPGGLLIDATGQIVVACLDGRVVCLGEVGG